MIDLAHTHQRGATAPAAVGAYIGAAYFFTKRPASFAKPPPSASDATVPNTFAGIAPSSAPGYIAAQIIGGLASIALLRVLYPDVTPAEAAEIMLPHGDAAAEAVSGIT